MFNLPRTASYSGEWILRAALAVCALLACTVPAHAQERPLFDLAPSARHAADVASTWTVGAQIGLETWHSLRADRRWHALGCQGMRLGAVVGFSEATKRLVHRTRPDGSDRYSFPSEHTMVAFSQGGWRASYTFSLGAATGTGRMAASKHYPSDVLAGALLGTMTQFLCHGE